MQFNFAFTTPQILWTLTLAAQLVLLVVLFGLQRLKRFPWFAASVFVVTMRGVAAELLTGRIPTLSLQQLLVSLDTLTAFIMLLVVVELARHAFAGVRRRNWWLGVLALSVVAIAATVAWGRWPTWQSLTADRLTAVLQVMRVASVRVSLLVNVLTIGLCLLVLVLGSRFKGGWRSHTQQILIGLSSAAITQIAVAGALQSMAPPHTRTEQVHEYAFLDRILNANSTIYIAVLIWWIGCLWLDEPATEQATVEAESAATRAEPVETSAQVAAEPEPVADPIATLPAPTEPVISEELLPAPGKPVLSEAPVEAAVAPAQVEEVTKALSEPAAALPQVEEAAQSPVESVALSPKSKRGKKPVGAAAGKRAKKQPAKATPEVAAAPVATTPVQEKKVKAAKPVKKKTPPEVVETSSSAAPAAGGSPSRARKKASSTPKRKKSGPPVQTG
jgi:hypothetical protein